MKFISVILVSLSLSLSAQDTSYTRKVIRTLGSWDFFGRGYVNKGVQKASAYLQTEFKQIGLTPFGKKYTQPFSFPVNTFPKRMHVTLDGRLLKPGVHYIVDPESAGGKGSFELQQKDSVTWAGADKARKQLVIVSKKKKLTFSVAPAAVSPVIIELLKDSFPSAPKRIDIGIDNKVIADYANENICGYVKGTAQPDSFLVFTAHYDHLGGMGAATYFPGANDNASGVSMLLNLAKHYAQHPSKYSVAFILFAGEEAGLIGSKYYVAHPLFPLERIKFLTNLDLLGTGEDGITVVNATIFKPQFERLKSINDAKHLLPQIKLRGKAANSDHYWFAEKGVPCFFIYTFGGIAAYHDVYDIPRTLPLTKYKEVYELLIDFAGSF